MLTDAIKSLNMTLTILHKLYNMNTSIKVINKFDFLSVEKHLSKKHHEQDTSERITKHNLY